MERYCPGCNERQSSALYGCYILRKIFLCPIPRLAFVYVYTRYVPASAGESFCGALLLPVVSISLLRHFKFCLSRELQRPGTCAVNT
eukprot:1145722-Pelagomonas_calceolata.AAC.2